MGMGAKPQTEHTTDCFHSFLYQKTLWRVYNLLIYRFFSWYLKTPPNESILSCTQQWPGQCQSPIRQCQNNSRLFSSAWHLSISVRILQAHFLLRGSECSSQGQWGTAAYQGVHISVPAMMQQRAEFFPMAKVTIWYTCTPRLSWAKLTPKPLEYLPLS